jgi:hypothetical protein
VTRARAFAAAVPQRAWTAVAGLALLASLAVAAVIGAGLQVWRSAVGSTAQPPPATVEPPSSGLVILPGGRAPRPHVPAPPVAAPPPAAAAPHTPAVPVAFVPRGFTPLVVTAGGAQQRVAVPLTARAQELSGPETEAGAGRPVFAAHARPQQHAHATGKHHPRHAHRRHADRRGGRHRHHGRHR